MAVSLPVSIREHHYSVQKCSHNWKAPLSECSIDRTGYRTAFGRCLV